MRNLIAIILLICIPATCNAQAVWRGQSYSSRVCNNPRCQMCNSIQRQLASRPVQRVIVPQVISVREMGVSRGVDAGPKSGDDQTEAPKSAAQQATPQATIDRALVLAELGPSDVLAEIGCGDGGVLIQAANEWGCSGVGVEIDPKKAAEARIAVRKAGLSDRILIITGDARDFDPSEYGVTVAYAYLYHDLLAELVPMLRTIPRTVYPFHSPPGLLTETHGDVYRYRKGQRRLVYRPVTARPVATVQASQAVAQLPMVVQPVRYKWSKRHLKLVKRVTANCGHCVRWKANEQGKVSFTVTETYGGASLYPQFELMQYTGRGWKRVHVWTGYTSAATINAQSEQYLRTWNGHK